MAVERAVSGTSAATDTTASPALFHLAFPVHDLDLAEAFYVEGLGCSRGRRSAEALVLNFGGHQLVAHLEPRPLQPQGSIYPRHFGLIFEQHSALLALEQRAMAQGLKLGSPLRRRFAGTALEHSTLFLIDPSGNWLEFKHYADPTAILGQTHTTGVGDHPCDAGRSG